MASSATADNDSDMHTGADAPPPAQNGVAAEAVNQAPSAPDSNASQNTHDALPSALAALNSAWSGWLGGTKPAEQEQDASRSAQAPQLADNSGGAGGADFVVLGEDDGSNGAQGSADWFEGANRLWQTAVHDVGTRLRDAAQQVDGHALEESVGLLRKQSGRVVEDVQRGVRSIQLGELMEQASSTLRAQGEEARQIFVDKAHESDTNVTAPWEDLPEAEAPYGEALQREMLRLAVDSVYSRRRREQLFVEVALEGDDGQGAMERRAGEAMGALRAQSSLRRLRAMLVPARVSEARFWEAYFFHVDRVRAELVANDGQLPGGDRDGVDDDDDDQHQHLVGSGAESHGETLAQQHQLSPEDVEDVGEVEGVADGAREVAPPVEAHSDLHDGDDDDDEEFLSWRRGQ